MRSPFRRQEEWRKLGLTEENPQAEWNVAEWHGKMLVDRNGEKIGKLQDVYVDVETDEPQFAHCEGGLHRPAFDLCAAGRNPDRSRRLAGDGQKEQVKAAPEIEMHGEELSQADESTLYHHFEMNYAPTRPRAVAA